MFYTIYKVTNKINQKIYIGKHQTDNLNDGYYGSGKLIKSAIKKYGKENFSKEIMFIFETEVEMNNKEKELITEEFVSMKNTYNVGIGGEGGPHFKGKKHSSETKKLISSKSGKKFSELEKQNMSIKRKGKLGIPHTDEAKKKISNARSGRKHSPETIEKIKVARQKQKFSDETKNKMSESAKNRNNLSGPVD